MNALIKMRILFVVAFLAVTFTNCKKENSSAAAEIVPEPTVGTFATAIRQDFNTWTPDVRWGTVTVNNQYQAVCELTTSTSTTDTPRAELSDDGRFMKPNSTVTISGEFYLKKGTDPAAVGAFFQSLIFDYPTQPGRSHTSRANLMLIALDANKFKFNTSLPKSDDLYNMELKYDRGLRPNLLPIYDNWHTVKIIIKNNTYQQNGTLQCTIDGYPMTLVKDNITTVATTRTLGVYGASMKVGAYSMHSPKHQQGRTTVKNLYITVQ